MPILVMIRDGQTNKKKKKRRPDVKDPTPSVPQYPYALLKYQGREGGLVLMHWAPRGLYKLRSKLDTHSSTPMARALGAATTAWCTARCFVYGAVVIFQAGSWPESRSRFGRRTATQAGATSCSVTGTKPSPEGVPSRQQETLRDLPCPEKKTWKPRTPANTPQSVNRLVEAIGGREARDSTSPKRPGRGTDETFATSPPQRDPLGWKAKVAVEQGPCGRKGKMMRGNSSIEERTGADESACGDPGLHR